MKNKQWLLLVLLINNRPFEPGTSHAIAIVYLEEGATVTGSWEHHANSGMVWPTKPRMRAEPGTNRAWEGALPSRPPVLAPFRHVTYVTPQLFTSAVFSSWSQK